MNVHAGISFFPISIAANASTRRDAPGSFLRYVSGDAGGADSRILVKPQGGAGGAVILYPGQTVRLPQSVSSWQIENYANAATITGTLAIGDGAIEDDRVTGEVSVIDGGKIVSLSGKAFHAVMYCGPVAAQYSHVELRNPAGSGVRLIIENLMMSSSISTAYNARIHTFTTQLSTNVGSGIVNKYVGSATVSAAQVRTENNVALLGTIVQQFCVPASGIPIYPLAKPIILPPGYGVGFANANVNVEVFGGIDFTEEAI